MNKVVIVDDEMFVRQGLVSLIDWKKYGFEVVAEADNGEDGFDTINKHQPDVVITDIRMPVLDGLELIQKVKETLNYNTKFIIISGYSDFSYAQKAVKFGVSDFILKPIDIEEFELSLQNLSEDIRLEKMKQATQKNKMVGEMFTNLLNGHVNEANVIQWSKVLQIDGSSSLYYLILEVNNLLPSTDLAKNMESFNNKMSEVMMDLTNNDLQLGIYNQEKNVFGFLLSSKYLSHYQGNIEFFIEKLLRLLTQKNSVSITSYISKEISGLESFKEAYESANHSRKYKYALNEREPIFYEKVKNKPLNYTEITHDVYHSLMEQIEENRAECIYKTIDEIFESFQQNMFSANVVVTSVNRFINGIIQTINNMSEGENKVLSQSLITKWQDYNLTLTELKKIFSDFVIEAAEAIHHLRKNNFKGDIYKIKNYVEKNFNQNISLKTIAQKYYMNPVYMGQLFKKTFGVYFKEFLLSKRIEEAKKLLRKTDMRVYEVAEHVGFGSTDYFVTQFEKVSKMTPTEYRKQLLKKSVE